MGDDYQWKADPASPQRDKHDPRHTLPSNGITPRSQEVEESPLRPEDTFGEGISGPSRLNRGSVGSPERVKPSIVGSMVQICSPEFDREILRRKSYNVNMRLYRANESYRKIIESIANHMFDAIGKNWVDYSAEKGVAAPVLGFPFRMIAVSLSTEYKPFVMINPKIFAVSDTMVPGRTNCGAIRLKSTIEVKRPSWISIRYYDLSGTQVVRDRILKTEGGHMIQHEIDHLDGILITDRFIQQGHSSEELNSLWPGVPGP